MADSLEHELITEATKSIDEFRAKLHDILQNDRKLKADSKSLNSLKILINESAKYVELAGTDYMYYVIHGRGPGRFPPPDPITGKWLIPFPVAAKIAKFGNKAQYKNVADAFEAAYNELIEKMIKQSGDIALAYVTKFGTIGTVGQPEII
jgi:hypothetical protein